MIFSDQTNSIHLKLFKMWRFSSIITLSQDIDNKSLVYCPKSLVESVIRTVCHPARNTNPSGAPGFVAVGFFLAFFIVLTLVFALLCFVLAAPNLMRAVPKLWRPGPIM